MVQLDPALTEAFERDGVVFLPGILSAAEVAMLEAGVERNLADLGPLAMNATKPGEPGAFVEDFATGSASPSTVPSSGHRASRQRLVLSC